MSFVPLLLRFCLLVGGLLNKMISSIGKTSGMSSDSVTKFSSQQLPQPLFFQYKYSLLV